METLLKQEYEKTTDSELNQEQLEFIYSEAEKWFPEEAMIGILYTYDNKTGILEIKEEKRKQEALERMTFFELYDVKIGYTEEECRGIAIGKKYRKLFQQLNDDFLELYNSLDRTEDTCWEPLNEKIVYSLAAVYKTLTTSLSKKECPKKTFQPSIIWMSSNTGSLYLKTSTISITISVMGQRPQSITEN